MPLTSLLLCHILVTNILRRVPHVHILAILHCVSTSKSYCVACARSSHAALRVHVSVMLRCVCTSLSLFITCAQLTHAALRVQALDPRTRLVLFKMLNAHLFSAIHGCISTGKEANVYHAVTPAGADLAVKVCNFHSWKPSMKANGADNSLAGQVKF